MAAAYGLYTHITANRRRSVMLIAGLFLSLYALVFAGALAAEALRGGPSLEVLLTRAFYAMLAALPIATLGGAAWIGVSYKFHQVMINAVTGSHEIDRKTDIRLYNLLENLCISRGLTMPSLRIMETPELNAFASGMNEKQYAVTVTRGLLDTLNDAELEAVLAHELTHIRNGDVNLMVVAVIIAGIIAFMAELMWRWFAYGPRVRYSGDSNSGDRRASPAMAAMIIAGVIVLLAWILSGFLRFALSRSREYLADAGAVELTKNPDAMISALLKISGRAELPGAPSGIMEMCIENQRSGFVDLFATHPPIEQRVQALIDNAGGQMPQEQPAQEQPARAPSFIPEVDLLDRRKLSPWGAAPPASPWGR